MSSRQYRDPSGSLWEVFEVHRHTGRATQVRPALMSGWLAFVSANEKRRLPEYPADWADLGDDELHELFVRARLAPSALFPVVGPNGLGTRASAPREEPESGPAPSPPSDAEPSDAEPSAAEQIVRTHARSARSNGVAVIDAMVEMKRLLKDAGEDWSPSAIKAARRWFVESFYFKG